MYRSRRSHIEEKRNIKKAVWLVILTALLLLALVMWGVPILVKLAVFMGNLNSSRRPIDKSDIIPPPPPVVMATYEATSSATQVIRGWAEPGANVFLIQNLNSLGNVVAKDDGEWLFGDIELAPGKNEFVAVAIDRAGNKGLESVPVRMIYVNQPPKLEVTSPGDGSSISGGLAEVEVKGQTDPGVRLTVNDRVVVVGGDGNYVTKWRLNEGENLLVIVAADRAGNSSRKEIRVDYKP